jgi:hypothetical protein
MKSVMVCIPYKSRTMKWVGNVAHTDEERVTARFLVRNSEVRNYLEDLHVYQRIIICSYLLGWSSKLHST